jgi:hypothetical protein
MINKWVQGICTGAWDSRSLWHYDDFVVFVHHSFDKQQHKWTSYQQSLVTVTTWIADSFSVHQEFSWSLCTHLQALKAQEGTGLRWEEYILQQNVSIYSIAMHESDTTNTIYFTWGQSLCSAESTIFCCHVQKGLKLQCSSVVHHTPHCHIEKAHELKDIATKTMNFGSRQNAWNQIQSTWNAEKIKHAKLKRCWYLCVRVFGHEMMPTLWVGPLSPRYQKFQSQDLH